MNVKRIVYVRCFSSSFFLLMSDRAPDLKFVTEETLYPGSLLPDLHLADNLSFDLRVYVLRCKPHIIGGPFCYYVGLARKGELGERIRSHVDGVGAAFTKANPPLGIEYVWPASNRAVEAYVFFALMERLPESAAIMGRLGGWAQVYASPNTTATAALREQKRILDNRCIHCGGRGHYIIDCPSRRVGDPARVAPLQHIAPRPAAPSLPLQTSEPIDPLMPLPSRSEAGGVQCANLATSSGNRVPVTSLPVEQTTPSRAVPSAHHMTDDMKFESFCGRHGLTFDDSGWILLAPFVKAVGESKGHVNRFVSADSDCPKKLWLTGPRKTHIPVEHRDWKRAVGRGGGNAGGLYYCRKTFLKKVLLQRYPHKAS